jgi:hypothetical protein
LRSCLGTPRDLVEAQIARPARFDRFPYLALAAGFAPEAVAIIPSNGRTSLPVSRSFRKGRQRRSSVGTQPVPLKKRCYQHI